MSLSIKAKPLILVGCEGSGRSAISFHLTRKFPHKFQRVISHTTRKPRPSQKDKDHYYFVDDNFVTGNIGQFVTLTKSASGHYYGLLGDQIMRVVNANKVPIFKMTLEAYNSNITRQGGLQIKQKQPTQKCQQPSSSALQKVKTYLSNLNSNPNPNPQFLTRNKTIQTNALYITVPDIKQLQRRIKCSPLEIKVQQQRIQRAKKQQKLFDQYFQEEDIIRSEEDMDRTVRNLQSRLFQLY